MICLHYSQLLNHNLVYGKKLWYPWMALVIIIQKLAAHHHAHTPVLSHLPHYKVQTLLIQQHLHTLSKSYMI